ncbi:adenylate/guanylate cyclase domain-containing protein [uncultured Ruegeria sp.]|uniref:adenylate/guanylate cyclase domain-containing protein n=1 Tax=uncultured Ruegeria sp. TaxID=259304 RepID=UPI00260B1458|nr:adenylate/guanylate cyclase domain-containing protein [uncultured Ruegeria sp.]
MDTLKAWLASINLENYLSVFEENSVDLDVLGLLTEEDLVALDIPLGDRKRLIQAAQLLEQTSSHANLQASQTAAPGIREGPVHSERLIGELRQMTIMFVDLVNSTGLVQEFGVEAYRDILKKFQNCSNEAIHENFGYFAQFVGDGIVSYFGFPNANEDDAERAALSALQIMENIPLLDLDAAQKISARIGIATGDVIIEDLMYGSQPVDNVALGDIPNLAARLQTVAKPGQIAISGRTRRLLGSNFQCSHIGAHSLKGFADPVKIWLVNGAKNTELRFDKRKRGALIPLIGRKQEFDLIRGRWKMSCQQEGQAVFLSGEAGMGKSRLAEEVHKQLVLAKGRRLVFQCSPYHQNSPFYPVKSHLDFVIGLDDSDTPETKLRKLRSFFDSGGQSPDEFLAPFSDFLSIEGLDQGVGSSPEETKVRTLDALLRYVEKMSEKRPILILFEDLHWIDPSSEELLSLLIDRLEDLRVMVLGTYRPEYIPRWHGNSKVTTLSLSRLSNQETRHLVEVLLNSSEVLQTVEATIATRSEGVPLFVEEMVNMFAHVGLNSLPKADLNDSSVFPTSLRDLFRARLDHLNVPPDTISVCAALGRSFSSQLVAALVDRNVSEIESELSTLVRAQILITKSRTTEGRYSFRHALIRDTAYDAILPQKAKQLHHRIATVMMRDFPYYCDRNPEILALHLKAAEQLAAARDQWNLAAQISLRNFASHEAVAHLTAALDAHNGLEWGNGSDEIEIDLRQNLYLALEMRSWGSPDINVNLDRLIELKEKVGDKEVAFTSLNQLAGDNLIAGRPDIAWQHCERMAMLIETETAPALHTLCHHYKGMASLLLGEFDRAISHFDLALSFHGRSNAKDLHRYYPANSAVVDTVMRCWAGALKEMQHDAIQEELEAAIDLTKTQTSEFTRCYALSIIATIYCTLNDPERCCEFASEAHRISDKIEFQYWEAWASIILGWAEAHSGNADGGIMRLRAGLERYVATGSGQIVAFSHTLLASACLCKDEVEEAASQISEAKKLLQDSPVRFHDHMTAEVAQAVEARLDSST